MKSKKQIFLGKLLKLFKEKTCLTLAQLQLAFDCSGRTIQNTLQDIGYITSFTDNNKWYTLLLTPVYDENGLWFFNGIGFSKHGNMGETIAHFINKSTEGLTSIELQKILTVPCLSILSILHKDGKINRIDSHKGFVYFLKDNQKSNIQKLQLIEAKKKLFPKDADAIKILVALIHNPNFTAKDILADLKKDISCNLNSINIFIEYHQLEKKKK